MHIGNPCQIGKIENSLVGLSVTSYQTGTVNGKYNRKILNTYIMQNLIVSSLQEGRIDCHHRLHSTCCQSCCKGNSMLLCNSNIKESVFIHIAEPF